MITVRAMTIADYDSVHALWLCIEGMGINDIDDSFEGIRRYLARNPGTSFVALDGARVIGTILAGHDGRRGFLYHGAVLPEYRKQGIGRLLAEAALEALKREGVSKVGLLAFRENALGNQFWEAMGFGSREDCTYRDKKLVDMTYNPNPYKK